MKRKYKRARDQETNKIKQNYKSLIKSIRKKVQMNTFNKALISTVAALFASQAEAKGIHNSCLRLSDSTAGTETGEFFTNEA